MHAILLAFVMPAGTNVCYFTGRGFHYAINPLASVYSVGGA